MKSAVVVTAGDARDFVDLAVRAESAGWDAVFGWQTVWGQDPWIAAAAASMRTSTIRFGSMLTPVPRYRPWDLAGSLATLDVVSGGRAQLIAGLGAIHPGWTAFEADVPRAVRAARLDETLAVYDGLMRGQPFSFDGVHVSARPVQDFPTPPPPVQRPRVPVWVVGAAVPGSDRSLRRAARWDGVVAYVPATDGGEPGPRTPAELTDLVSRVRSLREAEGLPWQGYDVVMEGVSPHGAAGGEHVAAWADAGATWWVESDWSGGQDAVTRLGRRIDAGPPTVP